MSRCFTPYPLEVSPISGLFRPNVPNLVLTIYTGTFQGRGDFTDLMGRPVSPERGTWNPNTVPGTAVRADA